MAERRRSVRKKSFLRGCVYFNKRRSAIDCLIRDISDQGARIIFSGTTNFPTLSSFTFRTRNRPSAPTSSGVVAMKWAWPSPEAAAAPLASPQPQFGDLAQRVAELEAEMAGLRRTLKQLKRELPGGDVDAA